MEVSISFIFLKFLLKCLAIYKTIIWNCTTILHKKVHLYTHIKTSAVIDKGISFAEYWLIFHFKVC